MKESSRLALLRLPNSAAILAQYVHVLDAQGHENLTAPDKLRYVTCKHELGTMLARALLEAEFGTAQGS